MLAMIVMASRHRRSARLLNAVISMVLIGTSSTWLAVDAFAPTVLSAARQRQTRCTNALHVALKLSTNQFDVTKPVFDLFALRFIRGDALMQYNALNQSEPLRINLYGLLAFTFFSAPFLGEAVGGDEPMGLVGSTGSALAGLASVGLFVRECGKRSKQLARIEKELNAENLQVRLPNAFADMSYGRPESLLTLKRSSSPPRIIAVCGTASQLEETLTLLRVLGKRLKQSSTFVVPVQNGRTGESAKETIRGLLKLMI